jgi:hypothetical protein
VREIACPKNDYRIRSTPALCRSVIDQRFEAVGIDPRGHFELARRVVEPVLVRIVAGDEDRGTPVAPRGARLLECGAQE